MSLIMRQKAKRTSLLLLGRRGTGELNGSASASSSGVGGSSSSSYGDMKRDPTTHIRSGRRHGTRHSVHAISYAEDEDDEATELDPAAASCPICQETIGKRSPDGVIERWAELPCGHRFGNHCIKHYLRVVADDRPSCPVCRQPMYHACAHPVLPFPAPTPPVHAHVDAITPAVANDDARVFQMRLAKCTYCIQRETTPASSGSGSAAEAEDTKPSRWSIPLRWLRSLHLQSPRRRRRRGGSAVVVDDDDETSTRDVVVVQQQRIDENRARQQSAANGEWQGPWVDPFPKPRDMEWEKWWIAQAPVGA